MSDSFRPHSPTSPESVRVAENANKAMQLRAAGATFREIGEALGFDHSWARQLVLRALESSKYEAADLMRTQEGERLDRLQRAWWPRALNGDEKAARIVLRIIDTRARLFGLNAPAQVEVTHTAIPAESLDRELQIILGQLAEG